MEKGGGRKWSRNSIKHNRLWSLPEVELKSSTNQQNKKNTLEIYSGIVHIKWSLRKNRLIEKGGFGYSNSTYANDQIHCLSNYTHGTTRLNQWGFMATRNRNEWMYECVCVCVCVVPHGWNEGPKWSPAKIGRQYNQPMRSFTYWRVCPPNQHRYNKQ